MSLDHLVYATPDLDASIDELESRLGVRASLGGQHHGRGTRNALLALGSDRYLEVIGPDAAQPTPSAPRWFNIDAITTPRLVAWASKGKDLPERRSVALRHGITLGEIVRGSRERPDGVLLEWQLTEPAPLLLDGLLPFFIDWGTSPHPATQAARGLSMISMHAQHPKPLRVADAFIALGVSLDIRYAATPSLVVLLDTPRGRVELR